MTRKDFQLIADVLKTAAESAEENGSKMAGAVIEGLSLRFASALRSTNSNFDRDRFLRACGVGVDPRGPKPLEMR